MPYTVVQLPTFTVTTSATTSNANNMVDDATNIYLILNSTTTSGANIVTVQVEPTDTGANWFPLSYGSSGQSPITVSSSQGVLVTNVAFRQIRVASTGTIAAGTTYTILGSKQITVALAGLSFLATAIMHLLQACGPLAI